jgi:hypothetical protein
VGGARGGGEECRGDLRAEERDLATGGRSTTTVL